MSSQVRFKDPRSASVVTIRRFVVADKITFTKDGRMHTREMPSIGLKLLLVAQISQLMRDRPESLGGCEISASSNRPSLAYDPATGEGVQQSALSHAMINTRECYNLIEGLEMSESPVGPRWTGVVADIFGDEIRMEAVMAGSALVQSDEARRELHMPDSETDDESESLSPRDSLEYSGSVCSSSAE